MHNYVMYFQPVGGELCEQKMNTIWGCMKLGWRWEAGHTLYIVFIMTAVKRSGKMLIAVGLIRLNLMHPLLFYWSAALWCYKVFSNNHTSSHIKHLCCVTTQNQFQYVFHTMWMIKGYALSPSAACLALYVNRTVWNSLTNIRQIFVIER